MSRTGRPLQIDFKTLAQITQRLVLFHYHCVSGNRCPQRLDILTPLVDYYRGVGRATADTRKGHGRGRATGRPRSRWDNYRVGSAQSVHTAAAGVTTGWPLDSLSIQQPLG